MRAQKRQLGETSSTPVWWRVLRYSLPRHRCDDSCPCPKLQPPALRCEAQRVTCFRTFVQARLWYEARAKASLALPMAEDIELVLHEGPLPADKDVLGGKTPHMPGPALPAWPSLPPRQPASAPPVPARATGGRRATSRATSRA